MHGEIVLELHGVDRRGTEQWHLKVHRRWKRTCIVKHQYKIVDVLMLYTLQMSWEVDKI